MLRARVAREVLRETLTGGVKSCMILTPDGELLGSTSTEDTIDSDKKVAAIVAGIWKEYVESSSSTALQTVVFTLEKAVIAVTSLRAGQYLLCAEGSIRCNVGMLKLKLEASAPTLEEQLAKIGTDEEEGKLDA